MKTISKLEFNKTYGGAVQESKPKEPNVFQRVGNVIKRQGTELNRIISGHDGDNPNEYAPKSVFNRAVQATATAFNAIPQVAKETLPKPARDLVDITEEGIGKGFQWLGDQIGSNKQLQKWVEEHPEATKNITDVLETTSGLGEISSDILFAEKAAGNTQRVFNRTAKVVDNTLTKASQGIRSTVDNTVKTTGKLTRTLGTSTKTLGDKVTLKKIDPKSQTILKETPASKFDEYIKAGKEAVQDPRKLTPLERAGEKGHEVAKTIKSDLNDIGAKKSAALEKVGNTRTPGIGTKQIEKVKPFLQKKLTDSERSMVQTYIDELERLGKNPTAQSVDATIDKLQATLFERKSGFAVPTTSRVQAIINKSLFELNDDLKAFVDKAAGNSDYSSLNALYSRRQKIFSNLNKALGDEGNKGGSLMKRFFSPQDAGTKKLFAQIKKDYGVDLAQDATLAKFIMETLGDTRARSLLQLPPTTASSVVGKILEHIEAHLTSPERVLNKAREFTKP